MSKQKKTVSKGFTYRTCDDFAAYLNHMARQGWHFKEWRAGLVFEKGEPENAVYAVEVFSGANENDTRPEPKTREFAEYCEVAGWQFLDSNRKFCIFKKLRSDAADIMTNEERLQIIAKEEQKNIWTHLITAAVWSGLKLMEFSSISFAQNIFSNTTVLITALWLLLLVTSIGRAVHFYIWKYRMEARLRRGLHLHFGKANYGLDLYSIFNWISFSGCALYLIGCWYFGQTRMVLFFFGYLSALLVMGYLIAKFRPEANTNALIQTIVPIVLFLGVMVISLFQVYDNNAKLRSTQQIPLYAEDISLDYGEMKSSTGYTTNSIFGTHTAYSLSYQGQQTIFYVAYQTDEDWILDRLWDIETDGAANTTRTDCAAEWGAAIGFRNGNGTYYLRYPEGILILTLYNDSELNERQIAVILDKLEFR